eukprot:1391488-Amorphochlora_amoeboformis.AAC.2
MMHSICCNNILAKDYGYEVDKAAIEFLASMCRKNKKAQDQLSKHNVNHFILGRIVKRAKERPKSHKRLIQTCGHMLYCLAENNSTVKAGILGLMKTEREREREKEREEREFQKERTALLSGSRLVDRLGRGRIKTDEREEMSDGEIVFQAELSVNV